MVLGMHRSGTSLLSSWLQLCGINMTIGGDIGSGCGNERGHFEDSEFMELQHRSIQRQVRRSYGWKVRYPKSLVFDRAEEAIARNLIEQRNSLEMPWGWKDPRTVLFANDWKRIAPNIKGLVIHRDRSQVIASLVRRAAKSGNDGVYITRAEASLVERAYSRVMRRYVRKWACDVIETSLFDVLSTDGKLLLKQIEILCECDLQHVPLSDVVDSKMLNQTIFDPHVISMLATDFGCYMCWPERLPSKSTLNLPRLKLTPSEW